MLVVILQNKKLSKFSYFPQKLYFACLHKIPGKTERVCDSCGQIKDEKAMTKEQSSQSISKRGSPPLCEILREQEKSRAASPARRPRDEKEFSSPSSRLCVFGCVRASRFSRQLNRETKAWVDGGAKGKGWPCFGVRNAFLISRNNCLANKALLERRKKAEIMLFFTKNCAR